jgi:hypothetical protein
MALGVDGGMKDAYIFTLEDAAIAYAKAAEHMLGGDVDFLNSNKAIIPLFVSMLFQSLEISIKHAGVQSGLFTANEVRKKECLSGHGIKEIAALAAKKLGKKSSMPIVSAMTISSQNQHAKSIISQMIYGNEMENTRIAYATRCLGYGEVRDGDFAIINPIIDWVESVKQASENLPQTIDLLTQWQSSMQIDPDEEKVPV